jgi:hypothetical protein
MQNKYNCNLKCNQSKSCLNLRSHCCYITCLSRCDAQIFQEYHFDVVNTSMDICLKLCFFIIWPTRCNNLENLFLALNSTCFGQCLCPSSGVHSLYTQQWHMSYRFVDSLPARSGSILILLVSCLQTCMAYIIIECTVKELLMMDRDAVRNM